MTKESTHGASATRLQDAHDGTQEDILSATSNPYLRILTTLIVPACRGGAKADLSHAQKVFPGLVDSFFRSRDLCGPQPPTEETEVEVHEMYNKDGCFKTLFGSLSNTLDDLIFESHEQVTIFVQKHHEWLLDEPQGTFFLFRRKVRGKKKYYVAGVGSNSVGFDVHGSDFSRTFTWKAERAYRFVVPVRKQVTS